MQCDSEVDNSNDFHSLGGMLSDPEDSYNEFKAFYEGLSPDNICSILEAGRDLDTIDNIPSYEGGSEADLFHLQQMYAEFGLKFTFPLEAMDVEAICLSENDPPIEADGTDPQRPLHPGPAMTVGSSSAATSMENLDEMSAYLDSLSDEPEQPTVFPAYTPPTFPSSSSSQSTETLAPPFPPEDSSFQSRKRQEKLFATHFPVYSAQVLPLMKTIAIGLVLSDVQLTWPDPKSEYLTKVALAAMSATASQALSIALGLHHADRTTGPAEIIGQVWSEHVTLWAVHAILDYLGFAKRLVRKAMVAYGFDIQEEPPIEGVLANVLRYTKVTENQTYIHLHDHHGTLLQRFGNPVILFLLNEIFYHHERSIVRQLLLAHEKHRLLEHHPELLWKTGVPLNCLLLCTTLARHCIRELKSGAQKNKQWSSRDKRRFDVNKANILSGPEADYVLHLCVLAGTQWYEDLVMKLKEGDPKTDDPSETDASTASEISTF